MRLFNTHSSNTSKRRGDEAGKGRQEKKEWKNGGPPARCMKNANENCRGTTSKGWGQGENVSTETRKLDSAPQTTLQGGTTTLVGRAVIWPVMVRRTVVLLILQ